MNFFEKLKIYIEVKYIKKYIDNKYWKLADQTHPKITTVFTKTNKELLHLFYPNIDLNKIEKEEHGVYVFRMRNFTQYIYKIRDAIIEPKLQWTILSDKEIFLYSFPYIEDPWNSMIPRPSLLGYKFPHKVIKIDKAILIKFLWNNYYHFLNDIYGQLSLLEDRGIPDDIPLLVPHNYNRSGYVNAYFDLFPLKRKIIVQQPGEYYEVKELYISKENACGPFIEKLHRQVETISDKIAGEAVPAADKIFVTRNRKYTRTAINIEELEQYAREKGFLVIEPGDYTLLQQISLFRNAKKIAGIHSAGLSNIAFCKKEQIELFEVFPGGGWHPEHYVNICKQLGFEHTAMEGNGLNSEKLFMVDLDQFKIHIDKLIK